MLALLPSTLSEAGPLLLTVQQALVSEDPPISSSGFTTRALQRQMLPRPVDTGAGDQNSGPHTRSANVGTFTLGAISPVLEKIT